MKLILPRPPSVNHYWRFTSKPFPHWYISPQGKAYREEAGWIMRQQRRRTVDGEVELAVDLYYCRHVDLDNILKVVLDTLTHAGVLADDRQVASIVLHRYKVKHMKEEKLEIELFELERG